MKSAGKDSRLVLVLGGNKTWNDRVSLSINSENIFPIIKKWLYSDHDIFIRELNSNGCDAITKLKKLYVMGDYEEADDEKYKVEVRIDPKTRL